MESYKDIESQEKIGPKQAVEATESWDDLRRLAFSNPEVGKIYNNDRYQHLLKVAADFMNVNYPGGFTEDGYMIDGKGNKAVHITGIDDFPTEQEFFEREKAKLLEVLAE